MAGLRRKFTDQQKLAILEEARGNGVNAVLRKHKLSYSAFSRWRLQLAFETVAETKAAALYQTRDELHKYKIENQLLRKLVADQALELMRREEEWKKLSHA